MVTLMAVTLFFSKSSWQAHLPRGLGPLWGWSNPGKDSNEKSLPFWWSFPAQPVSNHPPAILMVGGPFWEHSWQWILMSTIWIPAFTCEAIWKQSVGMLPIAPSEIASTAGVALHGPCDDYLVSFILSVRGVLRNLYLPLLSYQVCS